MTLGEGVSKASALVSGTGTPGTGNIRVDIAARAGPRGFRGRDACGGGGEVGGGVEIDLMV